MQRSILIVLSAILSLVHVDAARADALPPDESCPSGEVWVRGHSGGCRKEAPDDCAPGWIGAIGGTCVVDVSPEVASPPCPGDKVARPVTLCLERRLNHGNGRVQYDPPREFDWPVGIVGPAAPCDGAERHVAAGTICIARDQTPTEFVMPSSDLGGPRVPRTGCGRGCEGGAASGLGFALVVLFTRAFVRHARVD